MTQLTVGMLKEIIRDLSDDTLIAVDGYEDDIDIASHCEVIHVAPGTIKYSGGGGFIRQDGGQDALYFPRNS